MKQVTDLDIVEVSYLEAPLLIGFIHQLALHQNGLDKVELTPDQLADDLRSGWLEAFFLKKKEEIIGSTIIYNSYSSWKGRRLFIDELIIKEGYRRLGYGQYLFDFLINLAKQRSCRMLSWLIDPENTEALCFYEKNQANISQNWLHGNLLLQP